MFAVGYIDIRQLDLNSLDAASALKDSSIKMNIFEDPFYRPRVRLSAL